MGVTAAGEVRALNALLNGAYVSLHIGDPQGGGVEVSGGAYSRQAYPYNLSGADPTVAANNALIAFNAATTDWGTVTHYGIYSAVSGGTLLSSDPLDNPRAIFTDDVLRFAAGALKVQAN